MRKQAQFWEAFVTARLLFVFSKCGGVGDGWGKGVFCISHPVWKVSQRTDSYARPVYLLMPQFINTVLCKDKGKGRNKDKRKESGGKDEKDKVNSFEFKRTLLTCS